MGESYWKIGLMTMAASPFRDAVGTLIKKKFSSTFITVYYLDPDNPEPNCPNSYASLHARRPNIHKACGIEQFISHD